MASRDAMEPLLGPAGAGSRDKPVAGETLPRRGVGFGEDGGESKVLGRAGGGGPRSDEDDATDDDQEQFPIKRAAHSMRIRAKTSQRKMTTREKLFLTPMEKWRRFGRFPTKLLLNVLLVVVTTLQIVVLNVQDARFYRTTLRTWQYFFFPSSFDFQSPFAYLYTIDDTLEAAGDSIHNFYHINELSIDNFTYWGAASAAADSAVWGGAGHGAVWDGKGAVPLTVTSYRDPQSLFDPTIPADASTKQDIYVLNETYLGPLDPLLPSQDIQTFFHNLVEMTLLFRLQNFGFGSLYRSCLRWNVEVTYDFSARGQIRTYLHQSVAGNCDTAVAWGTAVLDRFVWLNFVIVALATLHEVLSMRSLIKSIKLYHKVKRWALEQHSARVHAGGGVSSGSPRAAGASRPGAGGGDATKDVHKFILPTGDQAAGAVDWGSLTWQERLSLINWWFALSFVANGCVIAAAIVNLVKTEGHNPTVSWHNLLTALGTFLLWISLMRYLGHNRSYYTLVLTLRRSVPRVGRFLVGVTPVFFAYALFGVVMFANRVPRFGDLQQSLVTLFAVLNGDVIRDTYMTVIPYWPVTGQIFMYSFICLFIYVVLNVFIAIVEESFFYTAQRSMELLSRKTELAETLNEALGAGGDAPAGSVDKGARGTSAGEVKDDGSEALGTGADAAGGALQGGGGLAGWATGSTKPAADATVASTREQERKRIVEESMDSHLLSAEDRVSMMLRFKDLDELENWS